MTTLGETITTSHYGTQWRIVTGWKDHGGEDGVSWDCALEYFHDGNWHGSECWAEDMRRPIPYAMRRWLIMTTAGTCPHHTIGGRMLRCATCHTGVDDILAVAKA